MKFYLTQTAIGIILIFLIGSFLRFNNLANNPPGLNWDEVAFGYNAHSILETGRDEFGKWYPIYFRSLDDYKLPVYVYLTAASEKVFGYNNFAVRFPSAFFGSLTIIIVYLLAQILLKNKPLSLMTALFFAILPWHIQFSRMAAEATVGLFFFLTGTLLFLYGIQKKLWLIPVAIVFFFISQYTYLTFRFITPLFLLILVSIYFKHLWKKSLYVYLSCILLIVFYLILGTDTYMNRNASRFSGIAAITPYSDQYQQDIKELIYDGTLGINIPRRIFHDNHVLSSIDIVSSNYLSHFSPIFLFFNHQQARHYTPMFGLLYLWMLPFILIGAYYICKTFQKSTILIFSLLLLPPIPGSFAYDSPNTIRTIALVVPFSLLTSIGIYAIWKSFHTHKRVRTLYIGFLIVLIGFPLWHFEHQNSIHLPHETSKAWQYGRKEMTAYILKHQKEYKNVIVSTSLEWPNVFFLYYSKYDSNRHLAQGGTKNGSWNAEQNTIENISFRKFNYRKESVEQDILFVGMPNEFPKDSKPLYTINYLDGEPAIYIVPGKPESASQSNSH